MSKLKFAFITLCLFTLASFCLPFASQAQMRPVTVAPGFDFNQFADPLNIPDFNGLEQFGALAGPTALAFDARGRLFIATYQGKILILLDSNEDGRCDTIKTFATGMGIPLGLEFRANGDLYVTSNQRPEDGGAGRIIRLRDTNGDDVADERTILIDGLPSQGDHQTDRLRFGPDGLLYFGQGSATDAGTAEPGHLAEQPLNGTMLRCNVDAPNPQATLEIFATGLRNPFGMAFHPENGELFATDLGPGDIGTVAPPEEINWIVQGGNYGFPSCAGTPDSSPACQGVRAPIQQFTQHLTPTSLEFYTGPQAGDNTNNLLVTIYKRLHTEGGTEGGDLRRLKIEGDKNMGFRVTQNEEIAEFGLIDPGDGPVDTRIDPISGDIYVARFDPVSHANPNEHHHIIYRIHRQGSDAQVFIGGLHPSNLTIGSGATTIKLTGRRLKSGAVILADGTQLTTRQEANGEWSADLPVSFTTSQRAITIQAQNLDGTRSNVLSLSVTGTIIPPPPPDKSPQITSFFAYFKKRANVVNPLLVGTKAKKLGLVVTGADFDAGAQVLINGNPVDLLSSSTTELVGTFTKAMLAAPGDLNIQVRNSTGKVSNIVKLTVVSQ